MMDIEPTPKIGIERVYMHVDPAYLHTEPIRLWTFDGAPIELQAHSDNGGDEDWLMFVPKTSIDDIEQIGLLQLFQNTRYIKRYVTDEGDVVYIGCHK